MHRLPRPAASACGAVLLLLAGCAAASAAACDENDPGSPAGTTRITLGPSDLTDEAGDELRSFIETGSLGHVTATVVSSSPAGIVRTLTATAEVSRESRLHSDGIKGIDIDVALKRTEHDPHVVIRLRQVCASYFRNTFLY